MPSFLKPIQVRKMRWDMLRSHNTDEVAPWNAGPAYQDYVNNKPLPTMILPAAVGYNKWKRKWGSPTYAPSARQVASLPEFVTQKNPYQPIPFNTMEHASYELNQTPPMYQNFDTPDPLSRDVLDRPNLVDAPTLRALANVLNNPTENGAFESTQYLDTRRFPSTYVFTKR